MKPLTPEVIRELADEAGGHERLGEKVAYKRLHIWRLIHVHRTITRRTWERFNLAFPGQFEEIK